MGLVSLSLNYQDNSDPAFKHCLPIGWLPKVGLREVSTLVVQVWDEAYESSQVHI